MEIYMEKICASMKNYQCLDDNFPGYLIIVSHCPWTIFQLYTLQTTEGNLKLFLTIDKQTPSFNNTREDSTHGHHQMVNTKIRLIIFFAGKDGEALYSQQKQDRELTVA